LRKFTPLLVSFGWLQSWLFPYHPFLRYLLLSFPLLSLLAAHSGYPTCWFQVLLFPCFTLSYLLLFWLLLWFFYPLFLLPVFTRYLLSPLTPTDGSVFYFLFISFTITRIWVFPVFHGRNCLSLFYFLRFGFLFRYTYTNGINKFASTTRTEKGGGWSKQYIN
jgi:hypothetical protein